MEKNHTVVTRGGVCEEGKLEENGQKYKLKL